MVFCPILSTNIAKLMSTYTGHMIATLIFLNNDSTATSSEIKIFHHKLKLEDITFTFMLLK